MASTTHALVSQRLPPVHLQGPAKQNCSLTRISQNRLVATRKIRSALSSARHERRRCQCLDFHKELVPYQDAWLLQKHLVEQRHILVNKDDDQSDMVIILQHQPVYTLGTNGTEDYLKFDTRDAPLDVFRTERGGEVTYHGPGQIVMYPILNLRYHRMDLHWYLRSLEEVVIRVLSSAFTIKGSTRLEGLTGVWVGNEKLAAIGIRVTRWITYHGLALNVNVDLSPFQQIVPCGIRDRQVGSISGILGISPGETESGMDLVDVAHDALLKEFSEVFQLSLHPASISEYDMKRLSLSSNQLKNDKEIVPCPLRLY